MSLFSAFSAAPVLEAMLRQYRRTWKGSVVSGFASPLLYLASLGFGLGSLIDHGARGGIDGVPYVQFVAPGVLAATAMQVAVGESTYPVLGAVIWDRRYHAMLATPLRVQDLVTGHLAYLAVRLVLTTVSFAAVAAALGVVRSGWMLAALPVAVLGGLAHAAPVMAYALRLEDDQGFSVIFRLVLVPLFLFSGTFFPVDQLPVALRVLAWATPLWHTTDAVRGLALGRAGVAGTAGHVAYLALWLGCGVLFARRTFARRLVT